MLLRKLLAGDVTDIPPELREQLVESAFLVRMRFAIHYYQRQFRVRRRVEDDVYRVRIGESHMVMVLGHRQTRMVRFGTNRRFAARIN